MKKLFTVFLPILFFSLSVSVFAQERVIDNAGILDSRQKTSLTELINAVVSEYNFNLVIVTERDIGDADPEKYAADFYDNNGYGKDGSILLQVTETGDYSIRTTGRGYDILNETAFNKLQNDYVKGDDLYEAFRVFVLDWQRFLSMEAQGRSYNFFVQYNAVLIIIAWLIALAIGFIVVASWKGQMNTALSPTQAAAYAVPGSLTFSQKKDTFLGSKKTQTRRQSSSSSGLSRTTLSSGAMGRSKSRSGRR